MLTLLKRWFPFHEPAFRWGFLHPFGPPRPWWPEWRRDAWYYHNGIPWLKSPAEPVELPRSHDLQPRRWLMPDGSITAEAINHEAVDLLRDDPEEYFRRTGR